MMDNPTIKRVLNALTDMVNQSCQQRVEDGKCIVTHDFLSACEDAIYLLEELGIAKDIGGEEYELDWKVIDTITPD